MIVQPTLEHLMKAIMSLPDEDAAKILKAPLNFYLAEEAGSKRPAMGMGITIERDGRVTVDFDDYQNVVWINFKDRPGIQPSDINYLKCPEFIK